MKFTGFYQLNKSHFLLYWLQRKSTPTIWFLKHRAAKKSFISPDTTSQYYYADCYQMNQSLFQISANKNLFQVWLIPSNWHQQKRYGCEYVSLFLAVESLNLVRKKGFCSLANDSHCASLEWMWQMSDIFSERIQITWQQQREKQLPKIQY